MERDCAFCGNLVFESRRVYCEDCRGEHTVCQTCAEGLADGDLEGYRLVA